MSAGTTDNQKRLRIKYRRGLERCTCGGTVAYHGELTETLPTGFGFVGTRFRIDSVQIKGFAGDCMRCYRPVFAVKSHRHTTRYPKIKHKRRVKI